MRFAPLAALALSFTATVAQARDGAVVLKWTEQVSGLAEIVVTLRSETGEPSLTLRVDVDPGAQTLRVPLPPLTRATQSVQAGLVHDGAVIAQGAIQSVEGRIGLDFDMTLHPDLAVGFAEYWHCDDGRKFEVTHSDGALSVTANGMIIEFQPHEDKFTAANGSTLAFEGNRATLALQEATQVTCAPALFPPILPMTALARDESWRIDLDRGTAMIDVPGLPNDGLTTTGLAIAAQRGGVVRLRSEQVTLWLTQAQCRVAQASLTFPYRAELAAQEIDVTPEGCAGNPLTLLTGGEWRVESLLGLPIHLATSSELTIKVIGSQISGRGACNRYVGTATIDAAQLAFRDFGTTRLACATQLRNIELRFLDALEAATGFSLSPAGKLTLTAGTVPVLTATRRTAP